MRVAMLVLACAWVLWGEYQPVDKNVYMQHTGWTDYDYFETKRDCESRIQTGWQPQDRKQDHPSGKTWREQNHVFTVRCLPVGVKP